MIAAMILAIVSFSLLAAWNLCYFQWLYKYDIVYFGADLVGYGMSTKKAFMVWSFSSVFALISHGHISSALLPHIQPPVTVKNQKRT